MRYTGDGPQRKGTESHHPRSRTEVGLQGGGDSVDGTGDTGPVGSNEPLVWVPEATRDVCLH